MLSLSSLLVALSLWVYRVPVQSLPTLIREAHPPVVLPGSPSSVASWIDDSTLALADVTEQRVVLVNLRSGARRSTGRPGDGPGEYRGVNPPVRGPDGSLLVVDSRLRRASILGPDLGFRRTVTLPTVIIAMLRWDQAGLFCTWFDFTRMMTPVLGIVRITAEERAEAEPLARLDSLFGQPNREPLSLPPIVAAAPGAGGSVYLGKVDQYRILKLDPRGRTLRTFQRNDVPIRRFSLQEIEEQTTRLRSAGSVVPPAAANRVKEVLTGMAKPFFTLTGLSEDGEKRLWVVTSRADVHHTEVDVFASNGRFLGTVRFRGTVRSLSWNGNRVAAVVERAEGEEGLGVVDVYRLK